MDAEFRFHLDTQVNDYISQGLSREEAELRARREFGPVELAKDESRDQRPVEWLDPFLRDVRYACRSLRRRPGFAAAAVVTLALGIGANTAIFSIVRAVLLKPLPYSEPDRIVRLWMSAPQEGVSQLAFSGPSFADVRDQSSAFRAVAAHRDWPFIVTGSGEPVRAFGQRVSASLFEVFDITPLKGRIFTPEEDIEGKDSVAVISYHFWQHHFGGAADIVGRTVMVSDAPRTIIGIMPLDFQFPSPETDLWVPLAMTTRDRNRNLETFYVVGRLRDGVSLQQAQIETKGIASRLASQFPSSNKGKTIRVVPFHEDLVQDVRRSLLVLLGAVVFVLLITCANVGSLLLTRAASRFKEFALRSSLGATRQRLVRQLLTESLVLATLGGTGGIVMGHWCRGFLIRMAGQVPRVEQAGLDRIVLGFALSITAACALLLGVIPALQATKFDLAEAMKQGLGSFAGRSRLRSVLVVAEVSLAVVLLIGGMLMFQTLVKLNEIVPGFRTEGLLTFETFLSPNRYKTPERLAGFYQQVLERLQAIPGIRSA
jgi:putative ABC transport system permease protein